MWTCDPIGVVISGPMIMILTIYRNVDDASLLSAQYIRTGLASLSPLNLVQKKRDECQLEWVVESD